jgi:hypothetical protein
MFRLEDQKEDFPKPKKRMNRSSSKKSQPGKKKKKNNRKPLRNNTIPVMDSFHFLTCVLGTNKKQLNVLLPVT